MPEVLVAAAGAGTSARVKRTTFLRSVHPPSGRSLQVRVRVPTPTVHGRGRHFHRLGKARRNRHAETENALTGRSRVCLYERVGEQSARGHRYAGT